MAVCMRTVAGHIHCDEAAANGRTTTVVAVRLDDDKVRKIRDCIMPHSDVGYDSVGDYIKWLIDTQGLRKR